MKKVTLKRLQLTNFKGIRSLTVDFGPEQTTIAGDNATGKTTIFDAFTWCLFGKDSQDRATFAIKTVDAAGQVIERLEHEVSATLEIEGREQTFTRTLTEDWVTPRGKAEAEMRGNTTHYLIDGVEIKAKDYADRIAGIIDEQLFKLITNPAYFPNIAWQTQRAILLAIAGNVTYQEIAQGSDDFQAILNEMSGKDLAEFKQGLAYRRKKVKEELDKCPVEVNAIQGVTPEEPDYTSLEAEAEKIEAEIKEIDKALTDAAEEARQRYEKQRAKQQTLYALQSERDRIIHEATREHNKAQEAKNEKHRQLIAEKNSLEREYKHIEHQAELEIENLTKDFAHTKQRIKDANDQMQDLRETWKNANAAEYKESDQGLICPLYDIVCKDTDATARFKEGKGREREAYNTAKGKKLDQINERGKQIAAQKHEHEQELQKYEEALKALVQAYNEKKDRLLADVKKTNNLLKEYPEEQPEPLDASSLPQVIEINEKIAALEQQKEEPQQEDTNRTQLSERKSELEASLRDIDRQLNIREVIKTNRKKIEAILAREKELAQQKADLDRQDYTADQLQKELMDEVERRVNSLFRLVNFRMYEKQLNGGETPTCIATMNGVKYSDLNSAGKINAGLDIINTLCRYHQVTAPIFVDNAESINDILPTQSQIIKLVVTGDPELQINNQ